MIHSTRGGRRNNVSIECSTRGLLSAFGQLGIDCEAGGRAGRTGQGEARQGVGRASQASSMSPVYERERNEQLKASGNGTAGCACKEKDGEGREVKERNCNSKSMPR